MIGQAGTLESNDIMITVSLPEEGNGISIDLESVVPETRTSPGPP